MNEQEQKQLLSAYFDNEVTPEERALVENLLESSIDARQTLEEMSQLAEFIRSLPKEAAPETLASTVMQQAEQKMLLPIPAATNDSSSLASGKPFWLVWGCGLLATAAMLFVATRLFHVSKLENNYTQSTAVAKNSSSHTDKLISEEGKPEGFLQFDMESQGEVVVAASEATENNLKSDDSAPKVFYKKPSAPLDQPSMKGQFENREARRTSSSNFGEAKLSKRIASSSVNFRDINWNEVQVGSVLIYKDKLGDQIAVVEVTVVDVQKGLDTMQMLLARNDIPPMATAKEMRKKEEKIRKGKSFFKKNRKKKKAEKDKNARKDIVKDERKTVPQYPALFVETSKTQLAATLTALQTHKLFIDLQPQFSQVASVDIKNQYAYLAFPVQRQVEGGEVSQADKEALQFKRSVLAKDEAQKQIQNGISPKKNKGQLASNAAAKRSEQFDSLTEGKDAKAASEKPLLPRKINSYQMLVQMEKPVFSFSLKKQSLYRRNKVQSPFQSNRAKETDRADRAAEPEIAKNKDEDKKNTSSLKEASRIHQLRVLLPNGEPVESLKKLRTSHSIRVLFVFSKKRNRANATSKVKQK